MPDTSSMPPMYYAADAIQNAANIFAQGSMNRTTRKWNEKMYEKQKFDNQYFWNMQNEYNSPSSTMNRLKAAGLNPHLVYGSGDSTTAASPIDTPSPQSWNPRAPQSDMMSYIDLQNKQAMHDNLKAQNTVLMQDALLRAAQVQATEAGTDMTKLNQAEQAFKNEMLYDLKEESYEQVKANLRKTQIEATASLHSDERQQAMQANNMQQAVENILTSRANRANTEAQKQEILQRVESIKRDNTIKDFEIKLNKAGITKGDEPWYRALARIITGDIDWKKIFGK